MEAYIAILSNRIGEWVPIDESIKETIEQLLKKWGEIIVCEYEDVPDHLASKWGEYPNWGEVLKDLELIEEHGKEVVEAAIACEANIENYLGCHKSLEHWAIDHLDETGFFEGIPKEVKMYFNHAAWARDQSFNGDIKYHESDCETYNGLGN